MKRKFLRTILTLVDFGWTLYYQIEKLGEEFYIQDANACSKVDKKAKLFNILGFNPWFFCETALYKKLEYNPTRGVN